MERQGLRARLVRLEQPGGPGPTAAREAKATTAGPELKVLPERQEPQERQVRLEQRARKVRRVTRAVQGGHSRFAYR